MPHARARRARDAAQRLQRLVHPTARVKLPLAEVRLAPGAGHPEDRQRPERVELCNDEGSPRPDLGPNKLRGLVFGHLQHRACQDTVGVPEFIQNREVICVDDGNQVTGECAPARYAW